MGGTMPYMRARARNGLDWRPTNSRDPYRRDDIPVPSLNRAMVEGDLNRFERDVMGVGYDGDALAQEYADICGLDVVTVRRVLAAVFSHGALSVGPILDLVEERPDGQG